MSFSYSVMLDLFDKQALVVGGGQVAYRKIKGLLFSEAKVTIIAPEICDEIEVISREYTLDVINQNFNFDLLEELHPFIVIAATNDNALNCAISEYCVQRGIVVNNITSPESGNMAVQSVINKDNYAISISTYGQGPGFSKAIRLFLEEQLDERIDYALKIYIDVRAWLLATCADSQKRIAYLRTLRLSSILHIIDSSEGKSYKEVLEKVKKWLSCSLD